MLTLILLAGCSLFADDVPCSDGESQGITAGFDDGIGGCEYDDDVPDIQLLNYPEPYAASSFASCFKEAYAEGYSEGQADESALPTQECE